MTFILKNRKVKPIQKNERSIEKIKKSCNYLTAKENKNNKKISICSCFLDIQRKTNTCRCV
jgi:hypothetical protein